MILATRRLLKQGHRAIGRDDLDAAAAAFERAGEVAPDDPRGLVQLALAQARQGQCDAARATIADLVGRFPEDPVALLFAGRVLIECDDPAGAEPRLRAAAEREPLNPRIQQTLALCELMQGRIAEAAVRFEPTGLVAGSAFLALVSYEIERRLAPVAPVVDRDPPPPPERAARLVARIEERLARRRFFHYFAHRRASRILARVGERAYDREDHASALVLFETLRRINDDALIGHFGAGLAALHVGRPNQAVEYLAIAASRAPADPLIAASYANALYRAARFEEALLAYRRVEPAGPDDFHAHYGQGMCLAALGRKDAALERFRVAFDQFFLDSVEDCLMPSWRQLTGEAGELGNAERTAREESRAAE